VFRRRPPPAHPPGFALRARRPVGADNGHCPEAPLARCTVVPSHPTPPSAPQARAARSPRKRRPRSLHWTPAVQLLDPACPTPRHCRQSAAVDLVPHQGVAAESPLGERCEASPHSGRMKLLYLAAPGEDVPSATHTSLLGRYQPSCFKRRSQRKCREVSEPGFGHQDKGLASVERQALEVQAVR
jgi:hypothetical protein